MAARAFPIHVWETEFVQLLAHGHHALDQEIFFAAGNPVYLRRRRLQGEDLLLALRVVYIDAKAAQVGKSHAHHPDVIEEFRVLKGSVHGLQPAHAQAGQSPVFLPGCHLVVRFDIGDHILYQAFFEHHIGHAAYPCTGSLKGRAHGESRGLVGVTVGHHHQHGFCFTRIDQVVEDVGRCAQAGPGLLVTPAPVQQVEHRKVVVAFRISRRGVDKHAAGEAQGGRIVPHRLHTAFGAGLGPVQIRSRTGHIQHAGRAETTVSHDVLVRRVEGSHPVYHKGVGVEFRVHGRNRHRPGPVLVFLKGGHLLGKAPIAIRGIRHPVPGKLHSPGIGGQNPEGDRVVGCQLGRYHRGILGEFLGGKGPCQEQNQGKKG